MTGGSRLRQGFGGWSGDQGDHAAPAVTVGAFEEVDTENPEEQFRPGIPSRSRLMVLGRLVLVAEVLAPARRGSSRFFVGYHGVTPRGVWSQHAVIGDEMGSGRWDQGGEFFEKGEGIEPHGRRL